MNLQQLFMMQQQQKQQAPQNPFALLLAQMMMPPQGGQSQGGMQPPQQIARNPDELAGPGSIADLIRQRRQAADLGGQDMDVTPKLQDSIPRTSGKQGVRPNKPLGTKEQERLRKILRSRGMPDDEIEDRIKAMGLS